VLPGASAYLTGSQTSELPRKRRKRDDDQNEFLPAKPRDEGEDLGSLVFNEVLDEEVRPGLFYITHALNPSQEVRTKTTVVNRTPLMTAWATVVAERLGFVREEALSIGTQVLVLTFLPSHPRC
jgi:hypothetical protein